MVTLEYLNFGFWNTSESNSWQSQSTSGQTLYVSLYLTSSVKSCTWKHYKDCISWPYTLFKQRQWTRGDKELFSAKQYTQFSKDHSRANEAITVVIEPGHIADSEALCFYYKGLYFITTWWNVFQCLKVTGRFIWDKLKRQSTEVWGFGTNVFTQSTKKCQ